MFEFLKIKNLSEKVYNTKLTERFSFVKESLQNKLNLIDFSHINTLYSESMTRF